MKCGSVFQLMREVSHREYLIWQAYLDEEWNRPNRTDHYLMNIAAEVRRSEAKNPRSIKLDQFKIPFKIIRNKLTPESPPADQIVNTDEYQEWPLEPFGDQQTLEDSQPLAPSPQLSSSFSQKKDGPPGPMTKEQIAAMQLAAAKAKWLGMMTMPVKHVTIKRSELKRDGN